MKKIFIILIIIVLAFIFATQKNKLWCERSTPDLPCVHKITQGEYLSQISLQYYGTAAYWRELASINRAPNSDVILPGTKIFIPSQKVIQQLHRLESPSQADSLLQAAPLRVTLNDEPLSINGEAALYSESTERMYAISNDTLAQLTDFIEPEHRLAEKKLAFPIIFTGLSGILIGCVMLIWISIKRK